jgi:hypothetical protein
MNNRFHKKKWNSNITINKIDINDIKHFIQGVESLLEVSMYKHNEHRHHQQICLPWIIMMIVIHVDVKIFHKMWSNWNWHMGGDQPWNSIHMKQVLWGKH